MIYNKNYDDIIHLKHHQSKVHKPMKISDRAAQFAPFAALTGHDEAIKETGRIVEQKIELDDCQKYIISNRINDLIKDNQHLVKIIYFQQDDKKQGGSYLNVEGYIQKIDTYDCFIMINNIKIYFHNIYSLELL